MMSKNNENISLREKALGILASRKKSGSDLEKTYSFAQMQEIFHDLEVHQIELEMQYEELSQTYQKLDDAKERYFDLYNFAPVGYVTLSEEGLILESNLQVATLLGTDRQSLMNKRLSDFIYKEDQDIYYLYKKASFNAEEQTPCELRMLYSDGTLFLVELQGNIQTSDGFVVHRLIINSIAQRRIMEDGLKETKLELHDAEELMIAQSRQAAMGEMISMIAHQWRQPLSIISMIVSNFKIDLAFEKEIVPDQINKMSDEILKQTYHLSNTINDFSDFFKPNKEKQMILICTLMENAISIMQKSLENNNIALQMSTDCHEEVLTFPNELLQVFLNLINNAKDALLEKNVIGAKIGIEITEDEEFVTINISDNAGGIQEEILMRLGEPYVSSKMLNGTGLGIYMSKTLLEKHLLGNISWKNKDDGAFFTVKLPLHVKESL